LCLVWPLRTGVETHSSLEQPEPAATEACTQQAKDFFGLKVVKVQKQKGLEIFPPRVEGSYVSP
jgi:hypothetical protein